MDDGSNRGRKEDEKESWEGGEVMSSGSGYWKFLRRFDCYAMLCHGKLRYTVLCCALLIMLCYALLIMLCYAMLYYIILCCAILRLRKGVFPRGNLACMCVQELHGGEY